MASVAIPFQTKLGLISPPRAAKDPSSSAGDTVDGVAFQSNPLSEAGASSGAGATSRSSLELRRLSLVDPIQAFMYSEGIQIIDGLSDEWAKEGAAEAVGSDASEATKDVSTKSINDGNGGDGSVSDGAVNDGGHDNLVDV